MAYETLVRAGKVVLGCTISVNSPDIALATASAGFDYLWYDMEHTPLTLEAVRGMILATRGLPAIPFIRVPATELGIGARIMFDALRDASK